MLLNKLKLTAYQERLSLKKEHELDSQTLMIKIQTSQNVSDNHNYTNQKRTEM